MKQLEHAMFITNNCALSDLWRNKNLVKHQKASKYYEMVVGAKFQFKLTI